MGIMGNKHGSPCPACREIKGTTNIGCDTLILYSFTQVMITMKLKLHTSIDQNEAEASFYF